MLRDRVGDGHSSCNVIGIGVGDLVEQDIILLHHLIVNADGGFGNCEHILDDGIFLHGVTNLVGIVGIAAFHDLRAIHYGNIGLNDLNLEGDSNRLAGSYILECPLKGIALQLTAVVRRAVNIGSICGDHILDLNIYRDRVIVLAGYLVQQDIILLNSIAINADGGLTDRKYILFGDHTMVSVVEDQIIGALVTGDRCLGLIHGQLSLTIIFHMECDGINIDVPSDQTEQNGFLLTDCQCVDARSWEGQLVELYLTGYKVVLLGLLGIAVHSQNEVKGLHLIANVLLLRLRCVVCRRCLVFIGEIHTAYSDQSAVSSIGCDCHGRIRGSNSGNQVAIAIVGNGNCDAIRGIVVCDAIQTCIYLTNRKVVFTGSGKGVFSKGEAALAGLYVPRRIATNGVELVCLVKFKAEGLVRCRNCAPITGKRLLTIDNDFCGFVIVFVHKGYGLFIISSSGESAVTIVHYSNRNIENAIVAGDSACVNCIFYNCVRMGTRRDVGDGGKPDRAIG